MNRKRDNTKTATGITTTECYAFNKPYGVLCQFSDADKRATLADWLSIPDIYPAGRLDADSEGLLILTNDGKLQARITQPGSRRHGKLWKCYWVQVEGAPNEQALQTLRQGVTLKDGRSKPARAKTIEPPKNLWARSPPIRERQSIPTTWIQLEICEGRNRQVRRMTAAVGHPTLRLIRSTVGPISLQNLQPGDYRRLDTQDIEAIWRRDRHG